MKRLSPRMILAVLCVALSFPAMASALTVGISDNNPTGFTDSRFNAVHFKIARVQVPWDLMTNPADKNVRNSLYTYLKRTFAVHMSPLFSISADNIPPASNTIPSSSVYSAAVYKLMKAFPEVHLWSPWNEPDWPYRPALAKNPKLAAAYYNDDISICHGSCHVLAGELFLPAPQLTNWLKTYSKALRGQPYAWALHDYTEVRALNTSQMQVMYKLTKGPIWLTETGGVLFRGHWQYRNQNAVAAAEDEQFLFALPKLFPRITTILHYQWVSGPRTWDSGLVDYKTGKLRPAYNVVLQAARGKPLPLPKGVVVLKATRRPSLKKGVKVKKVTIRKQTRR